MSFKVLLSLTRPLLHATKFIVRQKSIKVEQQKQILLSLYEENEFIYAVKILANEDFQKYPHKYMVDWIAKRGHTEEYRIPEDKLLSIFSDIYESQYIDFIILYENIQLIYLPILRKKHPELKQPLDKINYTFSSIKSYIEKGIPLDFSITSQLSNDKQSWMYIRETINTPCKDKIDMLFKLTLDIK